MTLPSWAQLFMIRWKANLYFQELQQALTSRRLNPMSWRSSWRKTKIKNCKLHLKQRHLNCILWVGIAAIVTFLPFQKGLGIRTPGMYIKFPKGLFVLMKIAVRSLTAFVILTAILKQITIVNHFTFKNTSKSFENFHSCARLVGKSLGKRRTSGGMNQYIPQRDCRADCLGAILISLPIE